MERDVYVVPDRLSGLEAVEELRNVCKGREWRFVEVNVPYEVGVFKLEQIRSKLMLTRSVQEARAHRTRVVELMYPSVTEMDLVRRRPFPGLPHSTNIR